MSIRLFVAYFLTEGAKFLSFKGPRGMQDKPPGPVGYQYSPQATSPIINSAFAFGQMQSPTSWYLHLLANLVTNLLSYFLSLFLLLAETWKSLSILMLGLSNSA